MQILYTRAEVLAARNGWCAVGFIPTMGALHAGHLSLVAQAKADGLTPVVSIFVNPIQFNQAADYSAYPIRTSADVALLEQAGCAAVFIPSAAEMYPEAIGLTLNFPPVDQVLEGAHRPGHFSGVGVVVARLLHLIAPKRAYFGEKDLQQLAVVRRLVRDLAFDVEIAACPTTREPDGLAMSSRNLRLSTKGRALAPTFYSHLQAAWQTSQNKSLIQALSEARAALTSTPNLKLHYIEAVNPNEFTIISSDDSQPKGPFALVAAVEIEGVRLIDNIVRWH
jgi:pantoate--beta-alanine ligase